MKIRVGPVWAVFSEATREEVELICRVTGFNVVSFTKRKGDLHPTEQLRRVDLSGLTGIGTGYFPAGLLTAVSRLVKSNTEVAADGFISRRQPFYIQLPEPPTGSDFSFQDAAVNEAIGAGRGILHYPTGAGKTVITAKIIAALGARTLVIVPNRQLLNQTYDKFTQYFSRDPKVHVGKVGDGSKDFSSMITVSTVQSLYQLFKADPTMFKAFANGIEALFIDECHHVAIGGSGYKREEGKWVKHAVPGNTWYTVCQQIPAPIRFGLTATLKTGPNSIVLEAATGPVVSTIGIDQLVARKVLVPVKVKMIQIQHVSYSVWKTVVQRDKDRKEVFREEGAYENNIVNNEVRNQRITAEALKAAIEGKRVLVLVDLVDGHGSILNEMIPGSVFLHGSHKRKDREKGVEDFERDGGILIGTIFKEGFDCPAINTLIIAGGGLDAGALMQKIGRALRAFDGKTEAEVVDFYDDDGASRSGIPHMCRRHSEQRLAVYRSQPSWEVTLVE